MNSLARKTSFVKMHLLLMVLLYALILPFFLLLLSSVVSAASNNSECSLRTCGVLGQIGYPFGQEGSHCGASPYFHLTNCTDSGAIPLWPGLNSTYTENPQEIPIPAPAVTGINLTPDGMYNKVNLSWSQQIKSYTSNSDNPKCMPLPLDNSNSYGFPSSIKFLYTTAASADFFHVFQFTQSNILLLFNCSNTSAISASNSLTKDTDYCKKYSNFCNGTTIHANTSCYSYNSRREIDLDNFVSSYSCTHFQFFIVENPSIDADSWDQYALQLSWSSADFPTFQSCQNCENHNASCGFTDDSNSYNFKCFCSGSSGDYCGTNARYIGKYIGTAMGIITAVLVVITVGVLYRRHQQGKQPVFHLQLDAMCDRPVQIPYKSVSAFKDKVGEGGNGVVYRGIMKMQQLDNAGICRTVDVVVAVKVLDPNSRHSAAQFVREVSTIGTIHHLNVVKLLGFCIEKSYRILVYEFVSNGSLDQWLFRNRDGLNDLPILDWNLRYSIALGVAQGLCYLHEECRHRIVHCDIKPHNILLDENLNPKISDFGLAKVITRRGDVESVMTMAKGTPGYVAPEFWIGGESRLTTKFDVYSYGMVLLELISGNPNFNIVEESKPDFPVQAFEAAQKETFQILLDNRLNVSDLSMDDLENLRRATMVALWCIQDSPNSRPSMRDVVQILEGSLTIPYGCPPPPAILTHTSNIKGPFWNSNSTIAEASLISSGR